MGVEGEKGACDASNQHPATVTGQVCTSQYLKLGGKHSHFSPIPVLACTFDSKTHSHPPSISPEGIKVVLSCPKTQGEVSIFND